MPRDAGEFHPVLPGAGAAEGGDATIPQPPPQHGADDPASAAGPVTLDVPALHKQAYFHFQAAENVEAAAVFEQLLAADPDDALVRGKLITAYLRAVVQAEPKDPAEAERLLLRAIEVDRGNGNTRLSYVKFLQRRGRHDEAAKRLDELNASLAKAGKDQAAAQLDAARLFQLASGAYHRERDYAAAIGHLEQVLVADPRHIKARQLLPGACYRAGRLDHPALEGTRREASGEHRFADGLNAIARSIGVEQTSDDGQLPDRSGWTDDQRFTWGRRVDALIRFQVLGGAETMADLQRRTQPFALPADLHEGGAVVLLIHAGSINLAIGQVFASGMPYRLVTNSVPYGVADPERTIDVYSGRATTLLARMAVPLRRGNAVMVAVDGPLGRRLDTIEHHGIEYPIAAGPLVLAHQMRVKTHLVVGGYEARSLACRHVEGPPTTVSLETLYDFWRAAIRKEVVRLTALGPENYIRQPSPLIPA